MQRAAFVVTGRVQGVGFRANTQHEARRLGLTGFAQNLPDESVRVEAQGGAEELERLAAWLEHGPRFAEVAEVTRSAVDVVEAERSFEVR